MPKTPVSQGKVQAKNSRVVPKCLCPYSPWASSWCQRPARGALRCFAPSARSLGAEVLYGALSLLPAQGYLLPTPPSLGDHTGNQRGFMQIQGEDSLAQALTPSTLGMGDQL